MLELLQEAVMLRGNNIAKNAALLETAERMPEGFNLEQFEQDLMSGKGLPAFRKDMDEVLLQQVTRFPAMRIAANRKALMITGYRRFEVLRQAVEQLSQ
jgi:predicted DsbA family dithiol-disulfide isomerase